MTSLREALRRRLRLPASDPPDDPRLSYRLYWTGQARSWSPERRESLRRAAGELLATPDFEPNLVQRRYRLAQLDSSGHAGASLVALHTVLTALGEFDDLGRTPDLTTHPQGESHERQHPD